MDDDNHELLSNQQGTAKVDLLYRGLEIALSHLMNPDLGWETAVFESRLSSIRGNIVKSRLALLPSATSEKDKYAYKQSFEQELLNNTYHVNQEQLREWERQIREVDVPHMITTLPPPTKVSS
jgi:hypothetical protein